MAEPAVFSSRVTKYFTPELAPGVSLKSKERSKALYCLSVTISPPLVDSAPSDFCTSIRPFSIFQPFSGNLSPRALCQPWRSEEHTSELQSRENLVCRLLLEKKK